MWVRRDHCPPLSTYIGNIDSSPCAEVTVRQVLGISFEHFVARVVKTGVARCR